MFYVIIFSIVCIFIFVFINVITNDKDTKSSKPNSLKKLPEKDKISQNDHNQRPDTIDNKVLDKPLPIKPSYLMSYHERTMFNELKQSVPECHIFVQVSFSAILWSPSQLVRNKYNRKIADFVITDPNFNIIAVIELDDKSHDSKEQQERDQERDKILQTAGYKVLRYRYMPPKDKLRNDILF